MATSSAIGPGLAPIGYEAHMQEMSKPPTEIMERTWGVMARTDPNVSFEEYQYWAAIEREEERANNAAYKRERGPLTFAKVIKGRFSKGVHHDNKKKAERAAEIARQEKSNMPEGEKGAGVITPAPIDPNSVVTAEEWKTAARALRTASWGTLFYLITTDILGWGSTAFVYASLGFGAAAGLYIIMGIFAFASGWMIWKMFLGLDSSRFPLMSYGDLYLRIYGVKTRHFINFTQALCQFMTVAVLILGCGTTIAQLSQLHTPICFIACMIICMVIGMGLGLIRSLQRLGWICNLSVWMNIVSFIMILYAAGHAAPDYAAVTQSTLIKGIEPIVTFTSPPPTQYQQQAAGFAGQFNGVNQMVYSWGGCLLFVAFLGEMRHPLDFWKAMICAQGFIAFVYVFFGAYVYSKWGQYSASTINNSVGIIGLQTAGNALSLVVSFIACLLYFNIGMKTVYIEVFESIFSFPPITTRKGRWLWYALGPVYWIVAFIVAAAVPNINGISGFVGAFFLLNFTYTFPGLAYLGYLCQIFAKKEGEGFDPTTRVVTRHDNGTSRWIRGFTKGWYLTIPVFLYILAGLATSGIGTWAAIEGLIQVFGPGGTVATSFGCAIPI